MYSSSIFIQFLRHWCGARPADRQQESIPFPAEDTAFSKRHIRQEDVDPWTAYINSDISGAVQNRGKSKFTSQQRILSACRISGEIWHREMLKVRFPLPLRNVEHLLHERRIDISHQTVGSLWNRFRPLFAAGIRGKRASQMGAYSNWQWHLDEVSVRYC